LFLARTNYSMINNSYKSVEPNTNSRFGISHKRKLKSGQFITSMEVGNKFVPSQKFQKHVPKRGSKPKNSS
jgi:hypothetical protein